jgi:hypothetical protein
LGRSFFLNLRIEKIQWREREEEGGGRGEEKREGYSHEGKG